MNANRPPTDPQRVRAFARFFKNYIGVSSVVAGALPIPITALELLPVPFGWTKLYAVYASLFCFLILAYVFYTRHGLARLMFPEHHRRPLSAASTVLTRMPLIFIILAFTTLLLYHWTLRLITDSRGWSAPTNDIVLIGLYVLLFASAEAAFAVMAVKEYLQDVLGLSDVDLILGSKNDAGTSS